MYTSSWRFISILKKGHLDISQCYPARNRLKQMMRSVSGCTFSSDALQDKRNFRDIISQRKQQAKCSVLVELPTSCNSSQLHDVYSSYGQVKKFIQWKNLIGKNFMLVEFKEVHAVKELLCDCSYQGPRDGLPTFSRFLYYKDAFGNSSKNDIALPNELESQDLRIATSNSFVSEQMNVIYQREKLKDIHIRLRFILCTVLEDALRGIFPNCRCIPVGSTVNGLGNLRSDLNLFLAINTKQDLENSWFCHCTKKAASLYKNVDSHILCTVGDILETFLPCISCVKKNMLTEPSVVKFQHHILENSCSLTINDTPSMFMSELLFLCGELDLRVKILILFVKQWAYDAKITQSYGDSSITSFTLTLIVIFFLQTRPHPILPPLDEIQRQGVASNFKGQNDEIIDSLLKDFFYFFSTFNFRSKCISVNSAQVLMKPDFSPLYIQNPVGQELNLCGNVTQQQLDNLVQTASHTLWNLENIPHNSVMKKNLLELLLYGVEQETILQP